MSSSKNITVSNFVDANVASMALYDLWVKSAREIVSGISRDEKSKKELGPYWAKFRALRYVGDAERCGFLGVVVATCHGAVKEASAEALRTYVLQQSIQKAVNSGDLDTVNQVLSLM